jgi:hypothetical protein
MSKKVTMKAKKVTKSVTKKAQPKKKVVAKKVVTKKGAKVPVSSKVIAKKIAAAKKAVSKVIKKQVAKKQTKAVAKRIIAKKVTKKEAIKQKYQKLYKIVSAYSENLMQDVYSVVYRTKELKRFVNENLANKYIEQEVLIRLNEHAINTAKKSRAVAKELASDFE